MSTPDLLPKPSASTLAPPSTSPNPAAAGLPPKPISRPSSANSGRSRNSGNEGTRKKNGNGGGKNNSQPNKEENNGLKRTESKKQGPSRGLSTANGARTASSGSSKPTSSNGDASLGGGDEQPGAGVTRNKSRKGSTNRNRVGANKPPGEGVNAGSPTVTNTTGSSGVTGSTAETAETGQKAENGPVLNPGANQSSGRKRDAKKKGSSATGIKSVATSAAAKIQAVISPPQDALTAASNVKREKDLKEKQVGNISSLQKMISDIKNLGGTGSGGSQSGSASGKEKKDGRPSSRNEREKEKNAMTAPITIPQAQSAGPSSSGSLGKLKPDAPPFTPSFSPSQPLSELALPALPAMYSEGATNQPFIRPGRQSFGLASGILPHGIRGSAMDPAVELERQQQEAIAFRAQIEAQIEAQMQNQFRQQNEAAQRASLEHQLAVQRLQAQNAAAQQQLQMQQQRQQNLPPRFLNQQRIAGGLATSPPLYEEELGEGLPPISNFTFGQQRRESMSNSSTQTHHQQMNYGGGDGNVGLGIGGPVPSGGGASIGLNAGALAGIAARAHKRTGSEMNPVMLESLYIQQQIEALQAQQRALMQMRQQEQLGQPTSLSSLSGVLLAQQQAHLQQDQQQHYQQQTQQDEMDRQQAERDSQQAEAQAQADRSRQTAVAGLTSATHRRTQSHSQVSGSSLNDFVLPTFGNTAGNTLGKSSQYANNGGKTNAQGRQLSDMGPPPVPPPGGGHAHRGSIQTHRPTNSIIGSFGGFVNDMPEDSMMGGGGGGHHRTGSRSQADGSWRINGGVGGVNNNNSLLDLNQAQAQLQMLSQFRAAQSGGVGGHSKMASFSFPNMLPNLMMASTMGAASQSIVQQQQAFQMQLQQSGQGPQRKSLFAPYLPQGSLPPLLQAGKLVVGVLRVNKRNRSDAYVATDVLEADIYICGSKDRNRALEGDIVAVELLDVDEVWSSKKEKEEKKRKKEENSSYELGLTRQASRAKMSEKKKDDVEVEGQGMVLFEDEEVTDEQKPTYAGHVVAVVERMTGQLFSGQLGVLRPSSAATKEKQDAERRDRDGDREDRREQDQQRPKIVWFKPTDKRVPLIAIPTEQAPADFVENSSAYADRLFVALIKRWPITSLHPFGTLVEELGPIGDIEVETSALLKDCNFPTEEFTDSVVRCLPPIPWTIPDREYEVRRDMRSERVFTVDPPTAKDLDDALSIKTLEDGNYEIGVHIADVSYFVKPNTALDRDARKRATSVYMVQRAVPMLPPLLSEELCSLVPDVERLTFSTFFIMDSEGHVLSKKFERCIIKSCAKLAYDDAQRVIEGHDLKHPSLSKGVLATDIEGDIRALQSLAKQMRARRFHDGAMKINNVKLSFKLDEDGRPVDCTAYEQREANALIEEFMLLANFTSAQFIVNGLPEQALLRRHEPPVQRRIEAFVAKAQRLGYDFEGISSSDIQHAFDKVHDQGEKLVLQIMSTKAMMRAKYFCAGMLDIAKYQHFALNAPLYSHFTSPIRRYADILVHRMLEACLTSETPETKFMMDRDQVAKCAQHCNAKKDAAKLAQEQSTHLHLCYLIHDLTQQFGAVIRPAKVVGVLDSAFDVVVPEFGIEKRVHADKMPLDNHVYDEHKQVLSLYWSEQDVLSFLSSNSDDAHLKRIKAWHERSLTATHTSADDENAAPENVDGPVSIQRDKSEKKGQLEFGGLRRSGGHRIQDVKEMDTIPVIVSADISKSPPVIIVYAVNPYAS